VAIWPGQRAAQPIRTGQFAKEAVPVQLEGQGLLASGGGRAASLAVAPRRRGLNIGPCVERYPTILIKSHRHVADNQLAGLDQQLVGNALLAIQPYAQVNRTAPQVNSSATKTILAELS
jgi:hypothetical protein